MCIYVTIRGISYYLENDHPLGNSIHDGNSLTVYQNAELEDEKALIN
jgi:hypothetical protein